MEKPQITYSDIVASYLRIGASWQIAPSYAVHYLQKLESDYLLLKSGSVTLSELYAPRKEAMQPQVITTSGSKSKIGVVKLDGPMQLSDGLCSYGIQSLSEQLRNFYSDSSITGVLVEANTGGGEVAAGQELFNAVAERNKPVVFYSHGLASAGVMASLPADKVILAGLNAETGSIGVVATVDNRFVDYIKQNYTDYYADTSPNKREEMRGLMDGDPTALIESLNKADANFMKLVKQYRNLTGDEKTVTETLSGRMFYAKDAVKRGLADGIGTRADAIAEIEKLAASMKNKGLKPRNIKNRNMTLGQKLASLINPAKEEQEAQNTTVTATGDTDEDVAVLEAAATAAAEKMQSLETENAALKAELEAATTQIETLASTAVQLADTTTKLEAAQEEISQLKAQLANAVMDDTDAIQELQAEIVALKATAAERDELDIQAMDAMDKLTKKVASLTAANKELSVKLAAAAVDATVHAPAPAFASAEAMEKRATTFFGVRQDVKMN